MRLPRLLLIPVTLTLLLSIAPIAHAQLKAPVKLIRGRLINARTGAPVDGGRLWVFQGTLTEAVTNSRINPADGSFQVLLDASTEYRFNVVAPSYFRYDIPFVTPPESDEYEEVDTTFKVPPIPIGEDLFSGRLFDVGSTQLAGTDRLAKTVDMLKRHPNVTVKVTLTPDVMGKPKVQPKATKKPKKSKKKKGATDEPPPPPPAEPTVDFGAMGLERQTALKNYFKSVGISVTRLTWDIQPGIEHAPTAAPPLPPNVSIAVDGIQPLEDDDE